MAAEEIDVQLGQVTARERALADAHITYIADLVMQRSDEFRGAFLPEGATVEDEATHLYRMTEAGLSLVECEAVRMTPVPRIRNAAEPPKEAAFERAGFVRREDIQGGPHSVRTDLVEYRLYPTPEGINMVNGLRRALGKTSVEEQRDLNRAASEAALAARRLQVQ
jgi:hypothetical protein